MVSAPHRNGHSYYIPPSSSSKHAGPYGCGALPSDGEESDGSENSDLQASKSLSAHKFERYGTESNDGMSECGEISVPMLVDSGVVRQALDDLLQMVGKPKPLDPIPDEMDPHFRNLGRNDLVPWVWRGLRGPRLNAML